MIEELRRIEQEALQGWAKWRQEIVEQVAEAGSALSRKEKKTLPAQLLRGNLGNRADLSSRSWRSATTPVCRRAGDSLSRVFVTSAVVLTDFGAESSFGKAVERAKEHHRIQEARLALARMPDSVTARFGVTMGVANDMGNQLTACVVRLVGSSKTRFIVLAMEQVGWWNKSSVASARKGTI